LIVAEKTDVSVVICAYTEERWDDIVAAIESVQNASPAPEEIIVVIDYNAALLERVRTAFPGVTVVENIGKHGLSGGRNSGIAQATQPKILFLDDDAVATPDMIDLLSRWCDQPDVMGAGGKSVPLWKTEPPKWFPEEFYWVVGCSYRGLPETATPVRNVFGGAMCLRREIFDAVGGFREGIGRVDVIPLGCEETELCIRANQHWPARAFIYEPLAIIHHKVTAKRATWAYFRSRCYSEGLSKAYISSFVGASDSLSTERSYTFKTLPLGVLRGIGDVFRGDLSGLGRAGAIIAGLGITTVGYLVGRFRQFRASRRAGEKGTQAGAT
jgi:GT2 family glycosyltransferase